MSDATCQTCGATVQQHLVAIHVAWHTALLNDLERARNHRHVTPSDDGFINRTGNAEPIPDSWAREMPEVAR